MKENQEKKATNDKTKYKTYKKQKYSNKRCK